MHAGASLVACRQHVSPMTTGAIETRASTS